MNLYLLEYAFASLVRDRFKNIIIATIFALLVFILFSLLFIANSLKHEQEITLNELPDITVQKLRASRHYDIEESVADEILEIPGVTSSTGRVWGYYYFANGGVNFSIVGVDRFEEQYKKSLEKIIQKYDLACEDCSKMVVGSGVAEVMKGSYFKEYFNFIKPDGKVKRVEIAGLFTSDIALEANDMIVMGKEDARELFGLEASKVTDIVVKVANPNEVATIAAKIKQMHPDCRVITKDDLRVSYQNIFDYKSGLFLALFVVVFLAFFIIVYDKASLISSEEKREIGILKAVGWRIDDILKEKFYEALIVSLGAYFIGLLFALIFVYGLNAPLLSNIFSGYSQLKPLLKLPFVLDFQLFASVFFLSVPIYMAATIFPSWRVATMDSDDVMR
ncbi:MAG: ABC transporter permease [Epsilonproteobacteria bacterium]|nr:ABC transporter permease [Campylobacterota bacterium]